MRSLILVFFCLLSAAFVEAAEQPYRITYANFQNGEKVAGSDMSIHYFDNRVYLPEKGDSITSYMDFVYRMNVSIIKNKGDYFRLNTPFDSLPPPALGTSNDTILGYDCNLATFDYFSNKIEVWYTDEAECYGTPYSRFIPSAKALALKILINGGREIRAIKIEKVGLNDIPRLDVSSSIEVTNAEFEELKIKSRYTILPIFNEEKINFRGDYQPPVLDEYEYDKTYQFSKGTVIMKKIKLPKIAKDGNFVYVNLKCWSDGDAYDRTGSVFILPTNTQKGSMLDALIFGIEKLPSFKDSSGEEYQGFTSTTEYDTPIEVMRFFTSFGAGHFNKLRKINNYNWQNAAEYKQEISELLLETEEIWIGVFIGNYSEGGHKVSLELNFYPGYSKPENSQKFVQPLFHTINIMEMSGQNYPKFFRTDTLAVDFTLRENTENLKLMFTSTGHGGWGGGDEFNPKINRIFIDGKEVYSVVPWRSDCATYRLLNPASGNFENGMSSSDLSRSNWCPGTLTPPYLIPLNNLQAGKHLIEVYIDQGKAEGGSFSHWGVSGVLVGDIGTN